MFLLISRIIMFLTDIVVVVVVDASKSVSYFLVADAYFVWLTLH